MKKTGAPTAGMISEIAGVSKSTVSRALSGHSSIPEKTRKRVLAVAKQIGYEPNVMARSLTSMKSGVIGLVIGEMENPFYQEHIERLTHLAADRQLQVMLFQVAQNGDLLDVVPNMARYRLDGCIVIASVPSSQEAVEACGLYDIPVVLLNRVMPDETVSSVLCNNKGGGRELARFLLDGGHERIAVIRGRADSIVNTDRLEGFHTALEEAGVAVYAERVGDFRFGKAYRAARELLSLEPRPDAIFAVSDLMACGALDAVRDLGLTAAKDVSVVGFDGIRAARWPAYRLTSFEQPIEAMLHNAVRRLAVQADPTTVQVAETTYINGALRIRNSARVPKGRERDVEEDF